MIGADNDLSFKHKILLGKQHQNWRSNPFLTKIGCGSLAMISTLALSICMPSAETLCSKTIPSLQWSGTSPNLELGWFLPIFVTLAQDVQDKLP